MSMIRKFRRNMMPSRTLSQYMVKMLLLRFVGILIGLTTVLQMLDLLAQADNVLAAEGATWVSVVSYIALRAPQLASQFTPFATLLASLLTLATLNQSSEVIIMKSIGLSAHKILFPFGIATFVIGASHFAFNETIVVDANAELEYWQENDYAVDLPPNTNLAGRVWLKEDDTLILVESVSQGSNRFVLDLVSIFEKNSDGNLEAMVRADFAWHQDGKWTLYNVRRFDSESHTLAITPSLEWNINTKPERFQALTLRPDHVPFDELWASIQQLEEEGIPSDQPMASFLQKFAAPAASLLMPILAAVAAFGVHRAGNLIIRLVLGMALGFSFFVADNFMLAMGEFGVAPPFLAAWAPFFLFLTLGYAVIFNTEEGSKKILRIVERTRKKKTATS